jgi:hypothetical protein
MFFASCRQNNEAQDESGKEEAHIDEPVKPGTTSLTREQMKAIGVEIGSIENKELTTSLKASGTLRVPNQNKASVNSVYSGVVKSLLVQPGANGKGNHCHNWQPDLYRHKVNI